MKDIFTNIVDFVKGLMQPLLTLVSVFVFLSLAQSGYDQGKIFMVVVGVILFWFGYTAIKNFNFTNGSSAGNKVEPPKASSGQSTTKTSTASSTVVLRDDVSAVDEQMAEGYKAMANETWDGKPPVPFYKGLFMTEVETDVRGQYSEVNACTTFYEARDKISGLAAPIRFNNNDALKGAWSCVFELAGKAFEEVWGVPYQTALDHLNDNLGCTTCTPRVCTYPDIDFKARQLGMAYYYILRDYREVKRMLDNLG